MFFLLACTPPGSAGPDTAVEGPGFVMAELDPPFEHSRAIWAGVALLDIDDDGWLDIYFTNGLHHADALYLNLGDGRFEDVAAEVGLNSLAQHGGARAADIDNDGDTDLVVTVECSSGTLDQGQPIADGAVVIYENQGGTFTERPVAAVSERCPVSVDVVDLDNDGWLDLIVGNGIDPDWLYPWVLAKEAPSAIDSLLLNDGTGDFVQGWGLEIVSESEMPEILEVVTFTSAWFDIDGDGAIDRIAGLSAEPPGVHMNTGSSLLQDNERMRSESGLWMGIAPADYDGDGDVDLYMTNEGLSPFLAGYNNIPYGVPLDEIEPSHDLFLFDEGVFAPSGWALVANQPLGGDGFQGLETPEGLLFEHWADPQDFQRQPWSWAAVALDANADGLPDVAFTSNNCTAPMVVVWNEAHAAGPGSLLINQGDSLRDDTWALGLENIDGLGRYQDGRGLAVGDLDNDGYADLVYANRTYNPSQSDPTAQVPGTPRVMLNRSTDANWLQIELEGSRSNRDAIGAMVWVDGVAWPVGAGGATNSSSQVMLTVGLGERESADLVIRFPSGRLITMTDVSANQRLLVHE